MKPQLDDLGLSPLSPASHANRKSRWRKSTRRALKRLDDMIAASNKGRHISMGIIYVLAREIVTLGRRGLILRTQLPLELRKPEAPARSLAALCEQLESASKILESLARRQNTPLVAFPTFENTLHVAGPEVDTGALMALEEMKKGME